MSENVLNIIINGQVRKKEYTVQGESVYLFDHHGDSIGYLFSSDVRKEMKVEAGTELALKAPMPGIVTKVYHRVGDRVKKGQSIVAIEAMKMELVLKAEFDCTISKITAVEAEFVEAGKVLVELVL